MIEILSIFKHFNYFNIKKLRLVQRLFFLIGFSFLLLSCSGTGQKASQLSYTSFTPPTDQAGLYFARQKQYLAGGQLIKVTVDGVEIGRLGVGEYQTESIEPGNHTIRATISNLLGLGLGSDSISITTEKGKAYFFVLRYEQGLFSGKFTITETSKNGFTKVLN
jgi:hypothetical protein